MFIVNNTELYTCKCARKVDLILSILIAKEQEEEGEQERKAKKEEGSKEGRKEGRKEKERKLSNGTYMITA